MTIEEIKEGLKKNGYIPNDDICYAVFAALSLNKPILIEGDPGVGKTSLAIAVAKMLGLPFLRLQMYDGLTKDDILYDYDYQRQLLTLEAVKPKINEEIKDMDVNSAIRKVAGDVNFYGKEFLIPRPVLQTINGTGRKLLLIDEIPQLGPVNCPEDQKPIVFLTSNGYRELSGAMRRRCGYLYIPKKTREEIIDILKNNAKVNDKVAAGIAACIVSLQEENLKHPVSISEAVDWANFLKNDADKEMVMNSIGLLAKDRRDMGIIRKTVEAYSGNIVS